MKRYIIYFFLLFPILSIQAQNTRVACVGNSVTYGAGIDNREQNSYPAQLQRLLGDEYEVRNFGKSGATLLSKGHRPYIEQEEYQNALAYAADWVVIHLGLNDTDPRNWPNYKDDFVRDYLSLIDAFRQANPSCRIWICRMTPITHTHPRFQSGTRDWFWQIQERIETVAATAGTGLIDLHEKLYPRPDLIPDAVHPDAEGAGLIASTVYSALTGEYGGLQLPAIYSDHMVVQRDKPLRLEGIANAGEKIIVSIGGQQKETVTGNNGKWQIVLDPLTTGPSYILRITSPTRECIYRDVLAGEVWLCSGQSNMAFEVGKSIEQEKKAQLDYARRQPAIRFYDMKPRWLTNAVEWDKMVMDSLNNLHYFKEAKWQICDTLNTLHTSAVAFAFARMLADSLQVPIGLIINAVGGSPAEAWIDRKTLEFDFPGILTDWTKNDFIQPWVRERAMQNIRQSTRKGQRHPYEPVYLFESGIRPLQHYPIRGILCYQGESNAHNIEAYEKLLLLQVNSWRRNWGEELPFYYVQLSGINRPSWPWFRDTQRRLMKQIPHAGMAVSSDRGDSLDVHPRQKKDIGERLARWALSGTYGYTLVPSGPLVEKAVAEGSSVRVSFTWNKGLTTSDGKALRTFEVAETEGLYYPAQATIMDDMVIVRSDQVARPRYIRYGWQPYTRANLVNGEGLPASTFQIELENLKESSMKWTKLPDLPGTATTASLGVSAPFTAVWNDLLIVAGGCNFPDKPVTEGGTKRYYNEIFTLDLQQPSAGWKVAGRLPEAVAYGATVTTPEGVVCIGGNNNERAFKEVFLLKPDKNKTIQPVSFPSLPVTMDNLAATAIGSVIYVAGGNANGTPSKTLWCLDLENPEKKWIKLPDYPGPARVQPVLAAQQNNKETSLYLAGGFRPSGDGKMAEVPSDVLIYSPSTCTWEEESPLPSLADGSFRTVTGGCAMAVPEHQIIFLGGVNHNRFLEAIDRPRRIEEALLTGDTVKAGLLRTEATEYMFHPVEWYKFNSDLLIYDTIHKKWHNAGSYEPLARAGAGAVIYKNNLIIINGELKPGVRTPQVNLSPLPFLSE